MDKRNLQSIKSYLQRDEVQARVHQKILDSRSQMKVPIGGVVDLFGFSENQLRKWEAKGLLNPQRVGRHRHYSLEDLEKLAVIHELIKAKYPPGVIPHDIDNIWHLIDEQTALAVQQEAQKDAADSATEFVNLHINQRIENARRELVWRYYASFAMRASLSLIREAISDPTRAAMGLVLPLHADATTIAEISSLADLPKVGESLVGWLSRSGSSQTLLTNVPSFAHSDLYHVYRLSAMNGKEVENTVLFNRTLLLLDRRLLDIVLSNTTINVIQRLLAPLYEETELLHSCFGNGMRDVLDPATDIDNNFGDHILNGLADIIVRLGSAKVEQKWRFCCALTPNDTNFPLQQRSLVVRAQSAEAPYKLGKTLVSPNEPSLSISLRAYQSEQVIYRPEVYEEDFAIAFRELEKPASVIAIPTGGGYGTSLAVLYIVSDGPHAFSEDDQRVLSLLGRAVEEVLLIYHARRRAVEKLTDLMTHSRNSDRFLEKNKILTENDFVHDIEVLLKQIQIQALRRKDEADGTHILKVQDDTFSQTKQLSGDGLSIISIDIDKQSQLATRYGDQFVRNLTKKVGSYLQGELLRIFTDSFDYKLYYVCADRFYLVVQGLSLEETRKDAERIRRKLQDAYEISVLRSMDEETTALGPDSLQIVSVSVRLGVSFYLYRKLEGLLERYSPPVAVGNVRSLISRDIDKALDKGRIEGGNVVISWNPDPDRQKRGYIRWSPSNSI
jgi:DNA-binding transcriptional MerR regulator/GGDEF domain-containing protein